MEELSYNRISDDIQSKKDWWALVTVASSRRDEMTSPMKPIPRDNPLCIENTLPASRGSKRQRVSSEKTTLQDLQSLTHKNLVKKCAEQHWDEMNKRYLYTCKFPSDPNCDFISQSFGNEKKAFDQIKNHLKDHLNEPNISNELVSSQKTPIIDLQSNMSGSCLKPPKKAAGPMKDSCVSEMSARATESLESPSSLCSVKKLLTFKDPRINDSPLKILRNRAILKRKQALQLSSFDPTSVLFKDGSPLTFLNSCCVNEDSMQSNLCKMSDILKKNDEKEKKEHFDHCYAAKRDVKPSASPPPPSPEKLKDEKEMTINLEMIQEKVEYQPHLLIKTPKYPKIYNIGAFEVVRIEEVGHESNEVKLQKNVGCPEILDDIEPPSAKGLRKNSNPGCSKKISRSSKEPKATGSVLECVENKVSIKSNIASTQKSSYSASDSNAENSENMEIKVAVRNIDILKKKKHSRGDLVCEICDKQFTAVSSLINHYRSHAQIKEYSCNLCKKEFTRRHSLNYHMLIHQNKARFTCNDCQKTFRHPSHYREHQRKHTGEMPYNCMECENKFKTRNTYKRHMKIRHKKQLKADNTVIDL